MFDDWDTLSKISSQRENFVAKVLRYSVLHNLLEEMIDGVQRMIAHSRIHFAPKSIS